MAESESVEGRLSRADVERELIQIAERIRCAQARERSLRRLLVTLVSEELGDPKRVTYCSRGRAALRAAGRPLTARELVSAMESDGYGPIAAYSMDWNAKRNLLTVTLSRDPALKYDVRTGFWHLVDPPAAPRRRPGRPRRNAAGIAEDSAPRAAAS